MNEPRVNQLKVGVLLTYVSMGITLLISLIYTPIMIRLLGQNEYGLYNLVSSVIAYLGLLNFGFGSAYIRYYSKYKVKNDNDNISKLNGMFLVVFVCLAFIALIAGLTLSFFTKEVFGNKLTVEELKIARILMIILSINFAIKLPNVVFSSYITANERFVFLKSVDILRNVLNPFFVLPMLLLGFGSIGMALAVTFISIIVELIYIFYSFKKIKIKFYFKSFDKHLFKEMIIFSSFIFINMLVDQINWNVDKYIIGRIHGTASVAIYSVATFFNAFYLEISVAISSVFIPRVHRLVEEPNNKAEITKLFCKIGRIQFIVLSLTLTGFIFFGRPFINWWAGAEYDQSYFIVIILILAATVPVIQNIGIEIQRAKNLHKFRALLYIAIAVANILISIPLVIKYDGVGAALGTAIALLIGNGLIMNIYYHKKIEIDVIYFWKNILRLSFALVLPIIFGVVIVNFIDIYNLLYFVCGILIYLVVFCISMWLFGMNEFEKDLVRKPFSYIFKRKKSDNE